jgi:hypothetical protein
MVARRIPVPKVAGSIPVPFRSIIFGDYWKKKCWFIREVARCDRPAPASAFELKVVKLIARVYGRASSRKGVPFSPACTCLLNKRIVAVQ